MSNQFARTQLLFGESAIKKLSQSRVAVFGIGGVGGYTVEALARSGIGTIAVIDNDTVALSNINRQIIALHSTVGRYKVDVCEKRLLDINPDIVVEKYKLFFMPENADQFDFSKYDYIVDAIDTVSGKIALAQAAQEFNIPIISSMGAGNKLDPTAFEVADVYETSVCPLARVMRRELKKRGIMSLKVVYSKEKAMTPIFNCDDIDSPSNKPVPGSNAFVPSVAGLIIAGEVIKDLTGVEKTR